MKNQSGGAIFIILICIVMFAALSYAVSQSMRVSGGNSGLSKEKLDLQVTEVLDFFEAMKLRYTKLTTLNKVPVLDISFKNDVYKRVDDTLLCNNNNSACATSACEMYSPYAPDGVKPIIFNDIAATLTPSSPTYQKNGHVMIVQLQAEGIGSTSPDLALRIFGVSPEFCNAYNAKNGITTAYDMNTTMTSIGETVSSSQGNIWGSCTLAASWNATPDRFGEEATIFRGKMTFCAPARLDAANVRLAVTYILQAR